MRDDVLSFPSSVSLRLLAATLSPGLERFGTWLRAGHRSGDAMPGCTELPPALRYDIGLSDRPPAARQEIGSLEPRTLEGTWLRYL
jgi:hypothetical protein